MAVRHLNIQRPHDWSRNRRRQQNASETSASPTRCKGDLERDVPPFVEPDHNTVEHHIHARHLLPPRLAHQIGSRTLETISTDDLHSTKLVKGDDDRTTDHSEIVFKIADTAV